MKRSTFTASTAADTVTSSYRYLASAKLSVAILEGRLYRAQ